MLRLFCMICGCIVKFLFVREENGWEIYECENHCGAVQKYKVK